MVATLMADSRDAGLKDAALIDVVLMDMARRFEAVSQGAAPSEAPAVGSMEDLAAVANKSGHLTIGSSGHRSSKALDFR